MTMFKSLHERIAENLGWSIDQVETFSLLTLRDIMMTRSPSLAHEITLAIEPGVLHQAFLSWNGREGTTIDPDKWNHYDKNGNFVREIPASLTNAYNNGQSQTEESEAEVDAQFVDDDDDEDDDDEEEIEIEYDKSGYPIEANKNQNGFQSILNKKMSNCTGRYYFGWDLDNWNR